MITMSSIITVADSQVSCDLAGESAILDLKNGMYYGLNSAGAKIWDFIQEPRTVSDIRDALLAEYEVDATQCEQDLLELLSQLNSQGLIDVTHRGSYSN